MAYDFITDIQYFTRLEPLSSSITDWALNQAITIYIADNPINYDDTLSDVDNRLISILASSFVVMWNNGFEIPALFKLDEFTVQESDKSKHPEMKFFDLFWTWLRMYQSRGVSLQYKDSAGVFALSNYDSTIYEVSRTPETGATS